MMATCGEESELRHDVIAVRSYESEQDRVPDLADVWGLDAGALVLAEGHVQGELDGQAGHGPGGQGLDLGHGLDESGLGAVRLQRHLQGIVTEDQPQVRVCQVNSEGWLGFRPRS